MTKKESSTLLFLGTYGWAILSAIVVIAILYFALLPSSSVDKLETYSKNVCGNLSMEYDKYVIKGMKNSEISDIGEITCLKKIHPDGVYVKYFFTGNFTE